mgnify:CR=1 FL=1|jgi:HEAT repeat protein
MIPDLILRLADADLWTRLNAESALRALGSPGITLLCAAVADPDELFERRWRAAMLLGEMAAAEAVPALMTARHDPQLDLRQGAVWALGCIRNESAFAALLEIFSDPQEEEQLRFVTAAALANIDVQRTIPLLRAALQGSDAQRRAAHAMLATLAERGGSL